MDYQINLENFHGPLDLLLHLIEKNEVDIYNIPIALITEEYLLYLQTLQLLNLEGVGDFLVMAATLMQIKAKMLLPQSAGSADEAPEDDDPRLELAQKLIEYKRIKEAALLLMDLEGQQSKVYTRIAGEFADQKSGPPGNPLKNLSIWDLMEAFKAMVESLEKQELHGIPKQMVSVRQRMTEIMDLIIAEGRLGFKRVFSDVKTKIGLITCFLAVLELIRLKKVTAAQDTLFGEIILMEPEKVGNEI